MASVRIQAAWLAALCALAPAAQTQTFDLVEVNIGPNPSHPGIDYRFVSVTGGFAEACGVSAGDLNQDGFIDLFYCSRSGLPNECYINNGDGTFTEMAAALGVDETSRRRGNSLLLDYDNDGDIDVMTFGFPGVNSVDLDMYSLFRNNGAPTYDFTDVTTGAGGFPIGNTSETTTLGVAGGAAAADVNGDGFLDVVVTYWKSHPTTATESQDQFRLWISEPNPTPDQGQSDYSPRLYADRTLEAGFDTIGHENWQPLLLDIDRDGDPDLHLNVEKGPDVLLLNDGHGVFTPGDATGVGLNFNDPAQLASGDWGNEMGAVAGDIDNDGDMDFYITNPGAAAGPWKEDGFYRNDSDWSAGGLGLDFRHIGVEAAVTPLIKGAGWGVVLPDLDNDGDQDILTARGWTKATINSAFRNDYPATSNGNVVWTDITTTVPDFSGIGPTGDVARGLVALDFDNDGDLDVVNTRSRFQAEPNNTPIRAGVFLNTLSDGTGGVGNWLQVDLIELGGSLNTAGARLSLRTGGAGGPVQTREVSVGSSFLCQEPARQHFGLGTANHGDWIAVRWADGAISVATHSQQALSGRIVLDRNTLGADATGDLDGDGDLDCDDLALFTLGRAKPTSLDLISQGWPWRLTADVDDNGLLDDRDYASLRAEVAQTWCDVGGSLAGTLGAPSLAGAGSLQGGTPVSLTLTNAKPGSMTWLMIGFGPLQAPFSGGILVPQPDLLLGPLPISQAGSLPIAANWPVGLPSGTELLFQYWVDDAAGIFGIAASNGLSARTP